MKDVERRLLRDALGGLQGVEKHLERHYIGVVNGKNASREH
jgi:hypothetical protein